MSMPEVRFVLFGAIIAGGLCACTDSPEVNESALTTTNTAATASALLPSLGQAVSESALRDIDLIVLPDGSNLPEGSGTAAQGQAVYEAKCAACHGVDGTVAIRGVPALAGGSLSAPQPTLTVGSYWPYASTLFDYIRRAMPPTEPKSLSNSEVYQLSAYVLYLNNIIDRDQLMDRSTLPQVPMPNHAGFVDQSAL
ncbi:MAG: cytochrome c [Pseudomonadales bacterium]|nr:cytochrome c [Pseudomonadales bacterium]